MVGDPAEPITAVGPLITAKARDRMLSAVVDSGGRVVTGGTALPLDGWYVAPTIIDGLEGDAPLAGEEVSGPVCAILPVGDDSAAAKLCNDVRYGLVTSVFTCDLGRALAMVDAVDTGLIKVNAPTSGVDFWLPFGGEKESSYGPREQGKAARDFYTSSRIVTIATSRA